MYVYLYTDHIVNKCKFTVQIYGILFIRNVLQK